MKRFVLLLLVVPLVIACASLPNSQTLTQAKENLCCFEYTNGIPWEQVRQVFGEPPITPQPQPGTELSQNVRGYKNLRVLFYTKPQNIEEEGKIRFKEVVYKVEICKEK